MRRGRHRQVPWQGADHLLEGRVGDCEKRSIPIAESENRRQAIMKRPLSRRTVLRGFGTALALPFLEAMEPAIALAGPAVKEAPLRMAFLFVPNGIHMPDWTPKDEGALKQLPPTLEPLKPVKDHLLVLSGLTLDKARPNGDGPGDHARAMSAFLTGS